MRADAYVCTRSNSKYILTRKVRKVSHYCIVYKVLLVVHTEYYSGFAKRDCSLKLHNEGALFCFKNGTERKLFLCSVVQSWCFWGIPSSSYGNRGTPWTSCQFNTGLAHKTPSKRVKKGRLEGQSLSSTPTFTHSHNTSRERKSCSYYATLWLNLILLLMLLLRTLFLRKREKPNTTWFSSLVE